MIAPVGFYCWAGPGTIRMINLKYFSPPLNSVSLLTSYDAEILHRTHECFGVTDYWGMYSWGFPTYIEKEDYNFLRKRAALFHRYNMRLHAYIQGTNRVVEGHPEDWFCIDPDGNRITYYRGRQMVCVNNPKVIEDTHKRIHAVCREEVDGVFMDNPIMGQIGVLRPGKRDLFSFVGCFCMYCRKAFRHTTGQDIPKYIRMGDQISEAYISFRTNSLTTYIQDVAMMVKRAGKQFGTNSFDPVFDLKLLCGIDVDALSRIQDYILFENHSFPGYKGRDNHSASTFAQTTRKPVFVVSYKQGIGKDSQYSQYDIDMLYSEAKSLRFNVCLKGSEYITRGKWHNLDPEIYRPPKIVKIDYAKKKNKTGFDVVGLALQQPLVRRFIRKYINRFMFWYMENHLIRKICSPLYYAALT